MENLNEKPEVKKVVKNQYIRLLIRFGCLTRGVLFGLVGYYTIQLVRGAINAAKGTSEVLHAINDLPGGHVLLIITIIGLLGYSMWSVIRAIVIKRIDLKLSYLGSAVSYLILIIPAVTLVLNMSKGNSSGNDLLIKVLYSPHGNLILDFIGISTIISGIFQNYVIIRTKDLNDIWSEELEGKIRKPFMYISKIGIIFRNIVFMLIGYFFFQAGNTVNSGDIKNINGVLDSLKNMPNGYLMLYAIGIGLICFGIYSAALCFFVDIPE
jgi:hypothetical protein